MDALDPLVVLLDLVLDVVLAAGVEVLEFPDESDVVVLVAVDVLLDVVEPVFDFFASRESVR